MAVETGTATSHIDLLDKLRIFVSTNAALIAAGQEWAVNRWASNELLLKGQGLSGTEEIFVGIRALDYAVADTYNWGVIGAKGFLSGSAFNAQPSTSPEVYTCLWNSSIQYWFIANGQRIIVVAKVSTTYHTVYLGKISPYGTPSHYPYPVYVGAEENTAGVRWSSTDGNYSSPLDPGYYGSLLCWTDGGWVSIDNKNLSQTSRIWPYKDNNSSHTRIAEMKDGIDGSYQLLPLIMLRNSPLSAVGELDGCYYVNGYNNASENTITIGTDSYLVVQNIFRTTSVDYAAIKLA